MGEVGAVVVPYWINTSNLISRSFYFSLGNTSMSLDLSLLMLQAMLSIFYLSLRNMYVCNVCEYIELETASVGNGVFLSAEGDVTASLLANSNRLLLAFFPVNMRTFSFACDFIKFDGWA